MAISPFRFPSLSLSLSRSPSTTTTNLAYSHPTTNLPYSPPTSALFHSSFSSRTNRPVRPTSALFHSSSSRTNRPVRCRAFDDETGKERLEMFRAFMERMYENYSDDELELCILKLIRSLALRLVIGEHEEKLGRLRLLDPNKVDGIEKELDEEVERLFKKLLKQKNEDGHEDEDGEEDE